MSSEWESLVALNERLRPLNDPVAIQEAAVGLLAVQLQASRVQYAQIDGDDFALVKAWDADGASPLPFRGRIADFGEAIVLACRRGETIVVDDVVPMRASGPRSASSFSFTRPQHSWSRQS